jgi:hypothetical protein
LDNAITAEWSAFAGCARLGTDPAIFELAACAAAISSCGVAVVAFFARFNTRVATHRDALAGLSNNAKIGGVLLRAVGVAAIVIKGIAIVANLTRVEKAVAALDFSRAFALFGAIPIDFDLANTIAAVTGYGISVITFFGAALVVDSVAAALGYLRSRAA